uniref:Uncharacterized protein n=1 Tax=Panagrolaimus sp. JU765 TaxID=591449 RepID=A0AC34QTL3_9BILA
MRGTSRPTKVSNLRADNLLIAIRPTLPKGYKTTSSIVCQIFLSLVFIFIGLLEGIYSKRFFSAITCVHFGLTFLSLWFLHFFGWKYNSPRLLMCHTSACLMLALSIIAVMLLVLFGDIFNGSLMNVPVVRHQIQIALIEGLVSLPLLTVFAGSSWSHAKRDKSYSDNRRRFLFAMKALESYIVQKVSRLYETNFYNKK